MKRWLPVVASVVALCASSVSAYAATPSLLGAQKSPASGEAVIGSRESAVMRTQEGLLVTSGSIQDYARAHPDSGFAGVRIDPYHNSIDVYWHGPVPGAVTKLYHPSAAHAGTVEVHQAPYSLRDLQSAQSILTTRMVAAQVDFASVGPNPDGSGLTVTRPAPAMLDRDMAADLSGQVASLTSVPISVTVGAVPRLSDRFADTTPFWGGDFMRSGDGSVACSTGFPIFGPGAVQTYILSAYHCAADAVGATWVTGDGTPIGTVSAVNPTNDAMLIATDASQHEIWGGLSVLVPNGQFAVPVNGGGHPTAGEVDPASGAFSGEECGINTVQTGVTIRGCDDSGNNCIIISGIAVGDQQSHSSVAGNGDSGGPVFTMINGVANARGTITAVDPVNAPAACNGVAGGGGRRCSWRVFFPDIITQLTNFGTIGLGV